MDEGAVHEHLSLPGGSNTILLEAFLGHDDVNIGCRDLRIQNRFIIDDHCTHGSSAPRLRSVYLGLYGILVIIHDGCTSQNDSRKDDPLPAKAGESNL